ncbi:hypothetical protein [Rikenella microfusus]|uniref:hypothetical protein n=1 Tax=Rikenella microfusus TaxID=28139 RepID=UPI001E045C3D|nr:hypothetical protein [Rikenella microfusus]HJE87670.1 hypothetical protein [Rikenella microfusus]
MNFPVRLATVFSFLIAGVCGGASAQEATAHDILDQSLRVQHAFRSLSGTYRTMFTNFAPDDDTPAAAHAGRFILMRSRPNGPIDRLNFRDANLLKETPGDSVTCCADGTGMYYISPDGTGERLETTAIESMWIVSILDKMEARTRQMLDSAATAQLPDTTIDGRQCYFFFAPHAPLRSRRHS